MSKDSVARCPSISHWCSLPSVAGAAANCPPDKANLGGCRAILSTDYSCWEHTFGRSVEERSIQAENSFQSFLRDSLPKGVSRSRTRQCRAGQYPSRHALNGDWNEGFRTESKPCQSGLTPDPARPRYPFRFGTPPRQDGLSMIPGRWLQRQESGPTASTFERKMRQADHQPCA